MWRLHGSWSMPPTNYSYILSYSLNVLYAALVTWRLSLLSILERDPPLLLSWRVLTFLPALFFNFLGVFPDPMWKIKGQGCRMCTDRKARWGKFELLGDIKQTELLDESCTKRPTRGFDPPWDDDSNRNPLITKGDAFIVNRPMTPSPIGPDRPLYDSFQHPGEEVVCHDAGGENHEHEQHRQAAS